jgi:hypothetical protein
MWRQVRTRKKKKGHGWGAAGKRTKESDGMYISISRPLPGQPPTDCADAFAPAIEKAETEPTESSLVVENNTTSSSEERGEFTVFPVVPVELRLKIWAMTFKKEHVDLDIQNCWPNYNIGPGMHILPRPLFPVALYVNQESRTETMRHYCIISPSKLRLTRASNPPTCVNLSLDSGSFDFQLITNSKYAIAYKNWLTKLTSASRGGLASLQELEVRRICWDQSYKGDIDQEKTSMPWGRAHYILALKLILQFTGLKRICFTFRQCPIVNPPLTSLLNNGPECRQTIQAYMDRHKDNFIGNRAPEVKVRFWSERENASIWSTLKGDNLLETEELA